MADHPLVEIATRETSPGYPWGRVLFTVMFEVEPSDAHDFDDALQDWASDWKKVFEERKAKREEMMA